MRKKKSPELPSQTLILLPSCTIVRSEISHDERRKFTLHPALAEIQKVLSCMILTETFMRMNKMELVQMNFASHVFSLL